MTIKRKLNAHEWAKALVDNAKLYPGKRELLASGALVMLDVDGAILQGPDDAPSDYHGAIAHAMKGSGELAAVIERAAMPSELRAAVSPKAAPAEVQGIDLAALIEREAEGIFGGVASPDLATLIKNDDTGDEYE
jgi:hypothetical protein